MQPEVSGENGTGGGAGAGARLPVPVHSVSSNQTMSERLSNFALS